MSRDCPQHGRSEGTNEIEEQAETKGPPQETEGTSKNNPLITLSNNYCGVAVT